MRSINLLFTLHLHLHYIYIYITLHSDDLWKWHLTGFSGFQHVVWTSAMQPRPVNRSVFHWSKVQWSADCINCWSPIHSNAHNLEFFYANCNQNTDLELQLLVENSVMLTRPQGTSQWPWVVRPRPVPCAARARPRLNIASWSGNLWIKMILLMFACHRISFPVMWTIIKWFVVCRKFTDNCWRKSHSSQLGRGF